MKVILDKLNVQRKKKNVANFGIKYLLFLTDYFKESNKSKL